MDKTSSLIEMSNQISGDIQYGDDYCPSRFLALRPISEYIRKKRVYSVAGREVYRVTMRDNPQCEPRALKRIPVDQHLLYGLPVAFLREVAILQSLDHPYVVELLDATIKTTACFILMPLALTSINNASRSLKKRIGYLKGMHQLLEALSYIRSRSIAHRDIKPANILIFTDRLQLCDFDSAKDGIGFATPMTPEAGTWCYQAPEANHYNSSTSSGIYGLPADIWSLGCTLYYWYTGDHLFTAQTINPSANFEVSAHPEYVADYVRAESSEIPAYAISFIIDMLIWDPAGRRTPEDILRDPFWDACPTQHSRKSRERHAGIGGWKNISDRTLVVCWVITVATVLHISPNALYYALELLDLAVSLLAPHPHEIQLYACVCLMLGAKMKAIYHPLVSDFVDISNNLFSALRFVITERSIVERIKFDLSFTTPLDIQPFSGERLRRVLYLKMSGVMKNAKDWMPSVIVSRVSLLEDNTSPEMLPFPGASPGQKIGLLEDLEKYVEHNSTLQFEIL